MRKLLCDLGSMSCQSIDDSIGMRSNRFYISFGYNDVCEHVEYSISGLLRAWVTLELVILVGI